MKRFVRPYLCLLGSLLLAALNPILRRLPWRTLWIINPGTADDVDAYAPRWARPILSWRALWPAGILFVPDHGLSLVLGASSPSSTLRREPDACERLLRAAERYRCRRIALNGDLPSIVSNHRLWPQGDRFVRRPMGTVFMIEHNVRESAQRLGLSSPRVLVVGAGYTGALCANRLAALGFEVMALDTRSDRNESLDPKVRFLLPDAAEIQAANVVVLLTPTGDSGALQVIEHLRSGVAVISDTHPKLSMAMVNRLRDQQVHVFESALTRDGTFFFPKIPRWPSDTIPGCVSQALVEATAQRRISDQEDFDREAALSLRARLDEPPRRIRSSVVHPDSGLCAKASR
ncbi:MAG: hypothetical protein AAFY60_19020 [Myxococcota bacterium]